MTVAASAYDAIALSRRTGGGGSRDRVFETAPAAELLALAGLFCFAFWDFYLPSGGVRPLDLLGSALLAIGLFSPAVYRKPSGAVGFLLPVLCVLVISAAVVGAFSDPDNIRAEIGTCAGAGVFALFSFWPLTTRGVLRALNTTLVVSLAGFWMQFAWYYATGTVLNFHAIVGGDPRVLSWTFRAAGLY